MAFSKKDLGIFLQGQDDDDAPGEIVDLSSVRKEEKFDTYKPLEPQVDLTKRVSRWRPGQAPAWAAQEAEDDLQQQPSAFTKSSRSKGKQREKIKSQVISQTLNVQEVVLSSEEEETHEERKGIFDSSSEDDDEEDERNARRQRIRSKVLESNESSTAATVLRDNVLEEKPIEEAPSTLEQDEEEEGSSSEWETGTDESDNGINAPPKMLKPVFIPKAARETIKELEKQERLAELKKLDQEKKAVDRKIETRQIVADQIRREKNDKVKKKTDHNNDDDSMPDDSDNLDPEGEYQAWEVREMKRILRDRHKREELEREAQDILRRRNMTEAERRKEDEKLGKGEKEKKNWKFLQKYHHKGAFYMDDTSIKDPNDVRRRDISEATVEDRVDKEALPKVLQVKNFGKAGRSKYTHLADQDTSFKSELWNQEIRQSVASKQGGIGEIEGAVHPRKRSRKTHDN